MLILAGERADVEECKKHLCAAAQVRGYYSPLLAFWFINPPIDGSTSCIINGGVVGGGRRSFCCCNRELTDCCTSAL